MSEELKLNDLRRFAILTRTAVTYRTSRDGHTCVIQRNGVVQIPGISGPPAYDAEAVLADAEEFRLEPETGQPRAIPREELAALVKQYIPGAAATKEE